VRITEDDFLLRVHELWNSIWDGVFRLNSRLRRELEGEGFRVGDVEPMFNGYVKLGGRWRMMKYPFPGFEVSPGMEVGATLQGYYFVVAVPVERLKRELVESFLSLPGEQFIYGAVNFLRDFYEPSAGLEEDLDSVLVKIRTSGEDVVQMESDFKTPEELESSLLRFIPVCRKFGVFRT